MFGRTAVSFIAALLFVFCSRHSFLVNQAPLIIGAHGDFDITSPPWTLVPDVVALSPLPTPKFWPSLLLLLLVFFLIVFQVDISTRGDSSSSLALLSPGGQGIKRASATPKTQTLIGRSARDRLSRFQNLVQFGTVMQVLLCYVSLEDMVLLLKTPTLDKGLSKYQLHQQPNPLLAALLVIVCLACAWMLLCYASPLCRLLCALWCSLVCLSSSGRVSHRQVFPRGSP